MRIEVELPGELLERARARAKAEGTSLNQLFTLALEEKLLPRKPSVRRAAPAFGSPDGRPIDVLTPEQMDGAMFG